MRTYTYWSPHRAVVGGVLAAALAACGSAEDIHTTGPTPPDGSGPSSDRPDDNVAVIREGFDNTEWIAETSGVIHDVNLGQVTLPVRALPVSAADGTTRYTGLADTDGLVEAASIVVTDEATLQAADAVELRASREVHVTGHIVAGSGGVTILAGERIVVTGGIESLGPVRLQVAEPNGEVLIVGSVTTRAGLDASNPDAPIVEVVGRGSVKITGEIATTAADGRTGGDVSINVYGDIVLDQGHVQTTAEPGGAPGRIRLRTERAVALEGRGYIGVAPDVGGEGSGGAVTIQAGAVRLGAGSTILGGTTGDAGGFVLMTAAGTIELQPGARIQSGGGIESGSLIARAQALVIGPGASIEAGPAQRDAGQLRLEAVERMTFQAESRVVAAATECGPGGALTLAVGGPLFLEPGAVVSGGDALAVNRPTQCELSYPSGRIDISAREAIGLTEALRFGFGFPQGEQSIEVAQDVEVRPPNLSSGVGGFVRSPVIDRGIEAFGFVPTLAELVADEPRGTRVEVEMSGSDLPDGPFGDWNNLEDDPSRLETLRAKRYVRYRVNLYGRAFDAPRVDYLEIRLRRPGEQQT